MTFKSFFKALHGVSPFPWQERLAALVAEEGWPEVIGLPTASGKTACLDVAIYALATEKTKPGALRRQPRRIAFVVDRRLVVDEAYERARSIAAKLASAKDGVLAEAAGRLRALAGNAEADPLATAVLRGGIYRDDAWVRSPAQPTVLVSTVDQVGSGLLFRGYGVSPKAWPIHAGLLGNDTLFLVDEAHCARPFVATLGWIARYRGDRWAERPLGAPFGMVSLTATPAQRGGAVFGPDKADREHEVLGRRLSAKKPAQLVVAKPKDDGFVGEVAQLAEAFAPGRRAVGVVVNRVAAARAVHAHLEERVRAGKLAADVVLLTGRVRPIDRDALLADSMPRMAAVTGKRAAAHCPLVVVATQCIEVGANLDFDALVAECCPLDSLRQRFGRLDRLGLLGQSESAVVIRAEQLPGEKSKADPLYGEALGRTWAWLVDNAKDGRIDLGVAHVDRLLARADDRAALVVALSAPTSEAPVLLPVHVDLLAQTMPAPHVQPDPAVFLHGMQAGSPDVQVVWRADLADDPALWGEVVAARPPVSTEALTAPLYEVRKWLAGHPTRLGADVLGAVLDEEDGEQETTAGASLALRWRGPESDETRPITAQEIRPGDTVVVPSAFGGCDRFGWNPTALPRQQGEANPSVSDLAEVAAHARGRASLRLHPCIAAVWPLDDEERAAVNRLATRSAEDDVEPNEIQEVLRVLAGVASAPTWLVEMARHLRANRRRRALRHPSGTGFVVSSGKPMRRNASGDFTDEDDTSSAATRAVPLPRHLEDSRAMAEKLSRAAAIPAELARDCVVAARLHDGGKADPRFQVLLHGGDRIAAARVTEQLAKSAGTPLTGRAFAAARKRAGCPQGFRHELVSVRLAESAPALLDGAADPELVLHLIASHHGHCRPLAPVVEDPQPVTVCLALPGIATETSSATGLDALDSGVAERFWRLVRRYGWWGLALLEAVTRLADHRASEDEQREGA
jgi:CRISPR-associated endonuclease/helicase Cas3